MNGAAGFQKSAAGLTCESCHTTQSPQWYAWGPPNMQCRLCASCWIYWKKYGAVRLPKAATKPLRVQLVARPTLAQIMKELGEVAARSPAKPRIVKGTETNRTILNINRGVLSLLGKRTFNKQNGLE
ncbi:hypothetical protein scyTo_0022782, partial [Scyliorhinus torazame]|nr:hypothetical protein [Scyliorhinus torazame]